MNSFIDAAIARTRTVMTLMVLMVLAGVSAYISIPKEADPDIQIPVFYVSIVHQGISPEDAERLLIKPMETELRSLEGLDELTAIASTGHAGIILEFDVSFDKDSALADVREKVDLAQAELPGDTEEPLVREFNTSLFPVLIVTLSGDVPERTLFQHARALQDQIEGSVSTVLQAELVGHREELLEVIIDPSRMESYDVSQSELINAVSLNNRLVAAGAVNSGEGRFSVKVPGLFEDRDDVLNLPVKVSGDGVVTLSDLADIRRTFKDVDSFARFNGQPAIALEITKRIGENIVDNNKQVIEVVEKFSENWPAEIQVNYTLDASTWIFRALGSLQASIITAIALVMIVCVAALGMRSSILVGVAIPTSFMIGFLFMSIMGMTVNMMVMFGMLLSVGILVDGAIVVVEYADRKMAEGLDRLEAYSLGAKRMFWPIASSTATTLAAFLPMLAWPGVSGEFMSYLPITLIVVLTASFVTAMLFLPVLGSLVGKTEDQDSEVLKMLAGAETGDVRLLPGLTGSYVRMLDKLVHHPLLVLGGASAILVTTMFAYGTFGNGVEFFVDTEPEQAIILVGARGNLSATDMQGLAEEVEAIALSTAGVRTVFSQAGTSVGGGGPGNGGDRPADLIAEMMIELDKYETRRKGAIILEEIRQRSAEIPGITVEVRKREDGPPTGKDIQIELTSNNVDALLRTTDFIRHHVDTTDLGLIDVEDSRPLPGIEWVLSVDREMAGRFGADITTVGATVQLVTNGILIGNYRPDDAEDEVDIRVRYPTEYRSVAQLDQLRIRTNNGLVPISNFVSREPQPQVSTIERIDGHRRYTLKANTGVNPETGAKRNVDEVVGILETWLAEQEIDPAVTVKFRGANEEQAAAGDFLGKAMLAALFLMFIILLTQFNSFYFSVLTLSTVVLSTVGVLLGMMVTGQTFSIIMTGTGIVALAGIVVNNSIVLIDTYQRLLKDGMDEIEAVLRTAGQRLRPILLTTITTMFGLLPMAIQVNVNFFAREITYGGPVAAWWVQLSTAIIFGLGFSTLLTLVLVPVLLVAPSRFKRSFQERRFLRKDPESWRHSQPAE
ncbi:MAG TPA: AcrB/AcrD/AcrF family protein [Rhodobiaceae bacterium]|nr:AcrB/AcrD/AcrF family protein [Rhodobiaceae bacterium]|tara:strand:+ start:574 stop:3780 length:3207 start_codon:yes stop_codon:yes gene_type:complete